MIRALVLAVALSATTLYAQTPDELWRRVTIQSEPAATDALPHPEAAHEWWYAFVQRAATAECPAFQAMITLIRDAEAVQDRLLFTTILDGVAANHTVEFLPGSFRYPLSNYEQQFSYGVSLGPNTLLVDRSRSSWSVHAEGAGATIDFGITHQAGPLWHRRAPEGAGLLDVVYSSNNVAGGSIKIGATTCDVSTSTAYFEHVWGTWSRIPQWGVDFLFAQAGSWSVYARRTPMRGEAQFYPRIGVDPNGYWPPVLTIADGNRMFNATSVSFAMDSSSTIDPDLGIALPAGYTVTATGFVPDSTGTAPSVVTLHVGAPVLAKILLPTTRSGVLEGVAPASIAVDGQTIDGTSEVEMQRYGTFFPQG